MTEFNYAAYGVATTVQQSQEEAAQNGGGGGSFDVMPQHNNQLMIEDMKVSKNEITGTVNLNVTTVIVGSDYNGRKMWNNFNLVKKDGTLNDITKYQLSDLAEAVGYPVDQPLNNPLDLMGYQNPFNAQVKVKKGGEKKINGVGTGEYYDDKNEFANPKPMGSTAPSSAPKAQTQPQQPQQTGFNQQPQQGGFNQQPAQGGFKPAFTK